jgi:hypothetical protein
MKRDRSNIIKDSNMPEKLKEFGYYLTEEDIYNLPYGTNGYSNKEGLLINGRLTSWYEFKPLAPERAEKLADSLKVWVDDTCQLTLSDIYAAQSKT